MENWPNFEQNIKNMLCPPGKGFLPTPNSAQEKFNQTIWEKQIENLPSFIKKYSSIMLGIPSDCGGGIHRGASHGPTVLRAELLKEKKEEKVDFKTFDIGDLKVIPHLLDDSLLNLETINQCRQFLYQSHSVSLPVSPLSMAYHFASELYQTFPAIKLFSIGGDHSCSYPLIKAFLENKEKAGIKTAVIQFDAHTDLQKQRSGITLNFGTWAGHILPFLKTPSHLVQIGVRRTKQTEELANNCQNKIFFSDQIISDSEGCLKQIISHLSALNIDEIYITVDIDCLDESVVSATGTPEKEGPSLEDILLILDGLAKTFIISSADLMEFAPYINRSENQSSQNTTRTAAIHIASKLLESLNQS